MPPKYLTTKEAAERLGLTTRALYMRVHRGLVPVIKLGPRTLRFDPRKLESMMQQHEQEAVIWGCSTG